MATDEVLRLEGVWKSHRRWMRRSDSLKETLIGALRGTRATYEDFWAVTDSALGFACEALDLPCDAGARERLMAVYLKLKPFPEVPEALRALSGRRLAILSNGTPRMLREMVANAGLSDVLSTQISVDAVGIYTTSLTLVEGPNIIDVLATNVDGEVLSTIIAVIHRP